MAKEFATSIVIFFLVPLPPCSSSAGLLVSHRGEVRRHAEGQGATASAAAAGTADAAAQQRHHLGEPDRPGWPHPAVSGCKESRRVAHLHHHHLHPLLQPRGQRRRSQCPHKTNPNLLLLFVSFCSAAPFLSLFLSTISSCREEMRSLNRVCSCQKSTINQSSNKRT